MTDPVYCSHRHHIKHLVVPFEWYDQTKPAAQQLSMQNPWAEMRAIIHITHATAPHVRRPL